MKKTIIIILIILIVLLVIIGGSLIFLYFASGHNEYKTASDALDSTDLTQALTQTQIQANNEKFAKYEGENQRGSVVNALLGTVVSHNTSIESGDNVKAVEVKLDGKTIVAKTDTYISKKVDAKEFYNIRVIRGSDGCVSTIQITTVNSDDTDTDNTNTIDE